jgi:hypothetical protein
MGVVAKLKQSLRAGGRGFQGKRALPEASIVVVKQGQRAHGIVVVAKGRKHLPQKSCLVGHAVAAHRRRGMAARPGRGCSGWRCSVWQRQRWQGWRFDGLCGRRGRFLRWPMRLRCHTAQVSCVECPRLVRWRQH